MSSSHHHTNRTHSSEIWRASMLDDHHTEPPACKTFSIREYVFSVRVEHLSNNWPFSHKCMEVCVQHGIKDLLPAFESPASVRAMSKFVNEKDNEEHESGNPVNFNGGNAQKPTSVWPDMDAAVTGLSWRTSSLSLSCKDITDKFVRFDKECLLPLHVSTLENQNDLLAKDDGLLLTEKGSGGSMREPISGHVPKLDFSCILNSKRPGGHSTHEWKVKSRKKRRIADICAEAQPCTLEDLDIKNNATTTWAFDASVKLYGDHIDSHNRKKSVEGELPPSNLSETKPIKVLGFKERNQQRRGSVRTKQFTHDDVDGGSLSLTEGPHRRLTGLKDCTLSLFLRTKTDKNVKDLARKNRNGITRLKPKQKFASQIQGAVEECQKIKLTAASLPKAKPHSVSSKTNSVLQDFVKGISQHGRKTRTVKRMKKVESITSCGLISAGNSQYTSGSELLQSEGTELLCYTGERRACLTRDSGNLGLCGQICQGRTQFISSLKGRIYFCEEASQFSLRSEKR